MLLEIVWNPNRNIFVIPYLNHPVTWYGFLFACAFLVGFFLIRHMFTAFLRDPYKEESATRLEAIQLTDRLTTLVVLGGLIGARFGHVFFYEWSHYRFHLVNILKIWEGGLASHGGAIGVLIALLIFVLLSHRATPQLTFLAVLDAVVVPAAFAGGCIRIGNFINQEITGIPTHLPWGVIFMRPLDGSPGVAVHPVQLYESLFYFLVFLGLFSLWNHNKKTLGSGELSGWFFLLIFGFRFLIEYLKMPQNEVFDVQGWMTMGQVLSLPFILLGLFLLGRFYVKKKR
jgi:phosphatidylglycerol---prolipoprotein diacylglyceryl transferase